MARYGYESGSDASEDSPPRKRIKSVVTYKRKRSPRDERNREDSAERSPQSKTARRSRTPTVSDMAKPQADPTSKNEVAAKKPKSVDAITTRTGGAYIPPAKLRSMLESITDKASADYQRISWEALKKSIHGLINKVNVSNISIVVQELFKENIVRGRGLLARSIMQAQAASPTFTHVYAALVSIINSKFPQTGELILRRLMVQFRRGFRRNDKASCLSSTRFIAHLVNQQVAHELLALEILTLLLENPTDDSVEVAVGLLKEVGQKLTEVSPKGSSAVFERLRHILHDSKITQRTQYMIEVNDRVRKDHFKDHPGVVPELDLVEEADQITHMISLEEVTTTDDILNVFKFDPNYLENEEKYTDIRKELLDEDSDESGSGGSSGSESDEDDDDDKEKEAEGGTTIIDSTETNLTALRRTIYLTIQSSLDFEECAHKILKLELKPGQVIELCHMILDCSAQQRTYEKFYGLLAQRFCQIDKIYIEPFEQIFKSSYDTIHRFETNKLRNIARFFAHLFYTDAISWMVLNHIRLNEEDTTSSSRIFIKILIQELSEYMGLVKLNARITDPTLQEAFDGLFPRNNPRDTRFAINFFTSIGLGGLTDDLREHLKNAPKVAPPVVPKPNSESGSGSESGSESSSSSSSSSGSSSSSSSSSSGSSDDSSSSSESDSSSDEKSKKKKKNAIKTKSNKEKSKSKTSHHKNESGNPKADQNKKGKKEMKNLESKQKRKATNEDETNGRYRYQDKSQDFEKINRSPDDKRKEKDRPRMRHQNDSDDEINVRDNSRDGKRKDKNRPRMQRQEDSEDEIRARNNSSDRRQKDKDRPRMRHRDDSDDEINVRDNSPVGKRKDKNRQRMQRQDDSDDEIRARNNSPDRKRIDKDRSRMRRQDDSEDEIRPEVGRKSRNNKYETAEKQNRRDDFEERNRYRDSSRDEYNRVPDRERRVDRRDSRGRDYDRRNSEDRFKGRSRATDFFNDSDNESRQTSRNNREPDDRRDSYEKIKSREKSGSKHRRSDREKENFPSESYKRR